MTVVESVLSVASAVLIFPVIVLLIEIACAVKGIEPSTAFQRPAGLRAAVLVPAHDEEDGIGATVSGIMKQLGRSDRLIVVADNCSDETASRAREAGAETIERRDLSRIGKGYALDFGVRYLDVDSPHNVVIVDADCRLAPGTIDTLVACCHASDRAAQAFYEMALPSNADAKRRVAGFAWVVKNHVRPSGLTVLRLPCQLMGSGMAFPWKAIKSINLASGNIVEDVRMGLDLAVEGFAPVYCPSARVMSDFPTNERGFSVQRQRWETGSLRTAITVAPVMFLRSLWSFNVPLMAMAVDLLVPPLMMLSAALVLGMAVSFALMVAGGSALPVVMFGMSFVVLMLVLALAWIRFGRGVLLPRDLLALPGVFARKFGFYFVMWKGRGVGWIRTDRK